MNANHCLSISSKHHQLQRPNLIRKFLSCSSTSVLLGHQHFDCNTYDADWKTTWTEEQKHRCCHDYGVGPSTEEARIASRCGFGRVTNRVLVVTHKPESRKGRCVARSGWPRQRKQPRVRGKPNDVASQGSSRIILYLSTDRRQVVQTCSDRQCFNG